MKEKYLPIGTVVLLKDATKRLMITGYCSSQPESPNVVYDYVGCLFPEGNLGGDEVALFNHDQIGTIPHMGLVDDEFKALDKNIKEAMVSKPEPALKDELGEFANLPPFTPENIGNILSQINAQGDALKPIAEPTAFNEEAIQKPTFELPTLDGAKKKETEKKEKNSEEEIEDNEGESSVEEKVADGQPVLQLQPIFDNSTPASDSSSSEAPAAPVSTEFSGLARL